MQHSPKVPEQFPETPFYGKIWPSMKFGAIWYWPEWKTFRGSLRNDIHGGIQWELGSARWCICRPTGGRTTGICAARSPACQSCRCRRISPVVDSSCIANSGLGFCSSGPISCMKHSPLMFADVMLLFSSIFAIIWSYSMLLESSRTSRSRTKIGLRTVH